MQRAMILRDAFKRYTGDQDKVLPPEETVRRFKERVRSLDLDILQETKRVDNGRLGIPVYFSRCGKDAAAVTGTRKQMGKGATPSQAEASAVMELAERFSFFSFMGRPEPFVVDTYKRVADRAIDFEAIARSVHDDSGDLEIPRRIFENIPLKWTPAFNLTRGEEVLVPFDWFYTINEFNGPSAGNCAEEALCQGICEVVERHVSAVVSRGRRPTPAILPASASDPVVREMIAKYENAGIVFHLTDMTLGMGIPTVGMLAYDPSTHPDTSEIVWTAGTTPSPQKALSRALTEVAQLAGDFNSASSYVASGLPKFASVDETAFVVDAGRTVSITDLPDISNDNIRVEVENCVAALAAGGFEVYTVDIRHPALDIPAFYTIVPGAHFRERARGSGVGMFAAKLITEKSDPRTAIRALVEMETMTPGKYYLKFYLGYAHQALGEPEKAVAFYDAAMTLEPREEDIASICSYKGLCLKETGRYRQAIDTLGEGIRHDPERTDLYNLLGFCHFMLKEHEAAIAAFREVIRRDPASAIDYANIGSNYRDMGKTEKAIEYYEAALALDPGIDFAAANLRKLRE